MELMKTANMSYEKSWRRKPLSTVTFLIIMMNVFSVLSFSPPPCPKCPPGSRVKTDCPESSTRFCLPCITGSFMDEPTGQTQCFPCTNSDSGSRVKTKFSTRFCLPCIDGTFMDGPTRRKQCFSCTICDSGSGLRIKTSCTKTSNTVCEPLDGFYCTDPWNNHCIAARKHTSCQSGQYISHKGTAFTDTECTDCSSYTFSDGTFTSCQSHTKCQSINLQQIKPGTASTDAECGEQSSNTVVIVVAVVVLVLLVVVGVIGGLVFYKYRSRRRQNSEPTDESPGLHPIMDRERGNGEGAPSQKESPRDEETTSLTVDKG